MVSDPVVCLKDGWYFYDETWSDLYGPYKNREHADRELWRYVLEVLNGQDIFKGRWSNLISS